DNATGSSSTSHPAKPLPIVDDKAIATMQEIPGVKYAVPQLNFPSFARFNNRTRRINIGGAPTNIPDYDAFNNMLAGGKFSGEDAQEAILTEAALTQFNTDQVQLAGPRGGGQRFARRPVTVIKTDEERAREASQVIGKEIALLTLRSGAQAANIVSS